MVAGVFIGVAMVIPHWDAVVLTGAALGVVAALLLVGREAWDLALAVSLFMAVLSAVSILARGSFFGNVVVQGTQVSFADVHWSSAVLIGIGGAVATGLLRLHAWRKAQGRAAKKQ